MVRLAGALPSGAKLGVLAPPPGRRLVAQGERVGPAASGKREEGSGKRAWLNPWRDSSSKDACQADRVDKESYRSRCRSPTRAMF